MQGSCSLKAPESHFLFGEEPRSISVCNYLSRNGPASGLDRVVPFEGMQHNPPDFGRLQRLGQQVKSPPLDGF
jgi:hypothetical protein